MNDYLIRLINLIDRPNHEKIALVAKRAQKNARLVMPFSAAITAYLICIFASHVGGLVEFRENSVTSAIAIGLVSACLLFFNYRAIPFAERHNQLIAGAIAVAGLFISLAFALSEQEWMHDNWFSSGWPGLLAIGAISFLTTYVLSLLLLAVAQGVTALAYGFLCAFSSPIAVPIKAILAHYNNRAVKRAKWMTSKGNPIITFGLEGIKTINHHGESIFVASPDLRRDGLASTAGIPLFTLAQLSDNSLVTQVMNNYLNTYTYENTDSDEEDFDMQSKNFTVINPATGLLMVGGIGSLDITGNAFGTDTYQAHNNIDMGYNGFDQ